MLTQHLMTEKTIIRRMIIAFAESYFDPQLAALADSESTQTIYMPGTPTVMKHISQALGDSFHNKDSRKTSRTIDSIVDNTRVFGCFLADFAFYFYDLGNLMFKGMTPEGHKVILQGAKNPFISRSSISSFIFDWFLNSRARGRQLAEAVALQCDADKIRLDSNISKVREKLTMEELGIPLELLRNTTRRSSGSIDRDKTFFNMSDSKIDQELEMMLGKTWNRTSQNKQKNLMDLIEKTENIDVNSVNQSVDRSTSNRLLDHSITPENLNNETNKAFVSSLNALQDLTCISMVAPVDCTMLEGGQVLIDLLSYKPAGKKCLFENSLKIFGRLSKTATPCGKLRILALSLTSAMKELRMGFVSQNPEAGDKIQISQEVLLSVLIYLIMRSQNVNILVEYRLINVYVLLDKTFIHWRLVLLLKSAIKSITKMGLILSRLDGITSIH